MLECPRKGASRLLSVMRFIIRRLRIVALQLKYASTGFPKSTIIEPGVRIRITDGGKISFGDRVAIDRNATLIAKRGSVTIGDGSYIGIGSILVARDSIKLGHNCLVAEHVTVRDQDHAFETSGPFAEQGFYVAPICIGNNVWIGAKATITRGVAIGDNAVIGANAVVTKDIPANAVAVGVPARVIRMIDRT